AVGRRTPGRRPPRRKSEHARRELTRSHQPLGHTAHFAPSMFVRVQESGHSRRNVGPRRGRDEQDMRDIWRRGAVIAALVLATAFVAVPAQADTAEVYLGTS